MASSSGRRWRPACPAASGSYFDPHACLAETVAVPVQFGDSGVRGLGRLLTPGSGERDVPPRCAGASLPLWLASPLLERSMAHLRALPPEYADGACRALAADASAACLRGTYFYASAAAVSALPRAPDLGPIVQHALRARYAPLLARCLDEPGAARAEAQRAARSARDRAAGDPRAMLSEEEAALFGDGAAAVSDARDARVQARKQHAGGGNPGGGAANAAMMRRSKRLREDAAELAGGNRKGGVRGAGGGEELRTAIP
jgi:hypothetical protein